METNNVEMTPEVEVVECTRNDKIVNALTGVACYIGVKLLYKYALKPGFRAVKSKIDNFRKPKLQVVEDEEE